MVKRAIDGFVPRNTPARRAPVDSQKKPAVNFGDMGHAVSVRRQQQLPPRPITSAPNRGVRSDIDESLREISNNQRRAKKWPKKARLEKNRQACGNRNNCYCTWYWYFPGCTGFDGRQCCF